MTKRFLAHKNTSQAKISYQNKNKLTLNNKGNNFSRAHKLLGVTCFYVHEILSSKKKKINGLEIVLITSICNTTLLSQDSSDTSHGMDKFLLSLGFWPNPFSNKICFNSKTQPDSKMLFCLDIKAQLVSKWHQYDLLRLGVGFLPSKYFATFTYKG